MMNAIANVLTFVRNFTGPSLIIAVVGIIVGVVPTWLIARGMYVDTIAELRIELADRRASAAAETARRVEHGAREIAESAARLRALSEAVNAALLSASAHVRTATRELAERQTELSENARYACRREPLPAEYLERLRLPAE